MTTARISKLSALTAVLFLLANQAALACATCMGTPDEETAPAMRASILFLLAAIAATGACFGLFAVYLARRDGIPTDSKSQG